MATNFPTSLDVYSDKQDNVDDVLAAHVNNLQDAVEAVEAKIGVSGSAVATSLDYLLKNDSSVDPGHHHTWTYLDSFAFSRLTYAGLTAGHALIASGATAASFRALTDTDLDLVTVFARLASSALVTGLWTLNPGAKFTVGAAPSNPSAGQYHLYAKSDGLYYKSSGGVETGPLLGTSGSFVPLQPAANITVNNSASDYDFNIKGNANDYLFHLDAAQNSLMLNESGATALGSVHAKAHGIKWGIYGVSDSALGVALFTRNAHPVGPSPILTLLSADIVDEGDSLYISHQCELSYGIRVENASGTTFGVFGDGLIHLRSVIGLVNVPADPDLGAIQLTDGNKLVLYAAGTGYAYTIMTVLDDTPVENNVPIWRTDQWIKGFPAVLQFDPTDEDVRENMPYGVISKHRALYADIALSGTYVNAIEIPKGALNCRVIVRQKTTITGSATGMDVGTESDQNVWGDNISFDGTPPGNLTESSDYTASPPDILEDNKHVMITARGGTFSGGNLTVILLFEYISGTTRGSV